MGPSARPRTCWSNVAVVGDLGQEGRESSLLRIRRLFLCLAPLTLVVCALASAAPALADRSMSTRFSANTNGNITLAANTLEVCPAAAAGCTAARNTPPISSGTNNALNNNNYNMQYVNTGPSGGTVGGVPTFDSSSATLSVPAGATVLFAGLYWGADTSAGSVIAPNTPAAHAASGCPAPPLTNTTTCKANVVGLQVPGASNYTTVTANTGNPADFIVSSSANTRYTAFADVTSMVQAAGFGNVHRRQRAGGDRRRPLRRLDARGRLPGSLATAAEPDRGRRSDHGSVGIAGDHDPGIGVYDAAFGTRADDVGLRRVRGRRRADRRQRDAQHDQAVGPGQSGEQLLRWLDHEPGDKRHHAQPQRLEQLCL